MTRVTWPAQRVRTADCLDITVMSLAGAEPPFLVVNPPTAAGRHSAHLIPSMAEFCDAFLKGSACYEFEWRGVGLSAPFEGPLAIEDLVLDLEAVARAIGRPFHLLAFGPACLPVAAFAARNSAALLSLTLDSPLTGIPTVLPQAASDDEFDEVLHRHLRMAFDFPPEVVAREILPAFRLDVPRKLVDAWAAALAGCDAAACLAKVRTPVLVYAQQETAGLAAQIAAEMQEATTVLARSFAYNRARGAALRAAFDEWWHATAPHDSGPLPPVSSNGLSKREREVLTLLAAGRSNREISADLVVTEATVATHVRHVFEKTGCANRAEAAAYAVRHGLV
jgi:DNA-binding NarL/FixJ family response regulator